jgi:c(7)-type cytochrome triheme protein
MKKIALFVIMVVFAGAVFAAGPTKLIKILGVKTKEKNAVNFNHQRHVKATADGGAGLKCPDCHSSKLVAKMKAGANKITMAGTCGVCHKAGGKAAKVAINDKKACAKCHAGAKKSGSESES